ncbi:MAG: hypothetical protein IAF94_03450 [Pirellulaceae bacterium]|nr:hypothetical protein [Pirellulaceae bacterium]
MSAGIMAAGIMAAGIMAAGAMLVLAMPFIVDVVVFVFHEWYPVKRRQYFNCRGMS